VTLPERFKARLELMARVELAPALLFGARRLLMQLCGWLAARHAGTTAFVLRWAHDSMRSKSAGEGGELDRAHGRTDARHRTPVPAAGREPGQGAVAGAGR
jgi:hypothetical protein